MTRDDTIQVCHQVSVFNSHGRPVSDAVCAKSCREQVYHDDNFTWVLRTDVNYKCHKAQQVYFVDFGKFGCGQHNNSAKEWVAMLLRGKAFPPRLCIQADFVGSWQIVGMNNQIKTKTGYCFLIQRIRNNNERV
jgi:hypothetical protein